MQLALRLLQMSKATVVVGVLLFMCGPVGALRPTEAEVSESESLAGAKADLRNAATQLDEALKTGNDAEIHKRVKDLSNRLHHRSGRASSTVEDFALQDDALATNIIHQSADEEAGLQTDSAVSSMNSKGEESAKLDSASESEATSESTEGEDTSGEPSSEENAGPEGEAGLSSGGANTPSGDDALASASSEVESDDSMPGGGGASGSAEVEASSREDPIDQFDEDEQNGSPEVDSPSYSTDEGETESRISGESTFVETRQVGEKMKKLVDDLSAELHEDDRGADAAVIANDRYRTSLKKLNKGLTEFSSGVGAFRAGTAKAHMEKTNAIKNALQEGLEPSSGR